MKRKDPYPWHQAALVVREFHEIRGAESQRCGRRRLCGPKNLGLGDDRVRLELSSLPFRATMSALQHMLTMAQHAPSTTRTDKGQPGPEVRDAEPLSVTE